MTRERLAHVLPQAVYNPKTGDLEISPKKKPVEVQVGDTIVGLYQDGVIGRKREHIYRVERMTETRLNLKSSNGKTLRLKTGHTCIQYLEPWVYENFASASLEDLEKAKGGQVTRDLLGQLSKDLVDSSLSFKARLERLDEARSKLSELIEAE